MLWVSTATDRGATLDELVKSYRAVAARVPSRLCVHAGPGHTDPRSLGIGEQSTPRLFADSIFRNDPPLARLAAPQVEGSEFTLTYESELPLDVAGLHYTRDLDKPWTDRTWQAVYADITIPGRIRAPLPAERPLQAFVTTIDARGALVSSEPIEPT